MSEEKLVPKLRFLEFTDEWSEHKFENIFDIKNGLNKGKDYFGEGIRILNYMDVNKYELNTENTIKGLVELTDDEIERYSVKPNDLFFTRTSETSEEIGLTSAYIGNTIKCVFSGFLLRARPKIDLNSLFFAYYLRSPRQRNNIIKFSSITTRALISGGNLSKMKIKYPSIEEQNKIANLFLILDKKVELLEKKYREYQCFKKYLMQKLFAQELRFDFNDEWRIRRLNEITFYQEGPGVRNYQYTKEGVKLLNVGNFVNNALELDNTDKYISNEEAYGKYKHFLVDEGDLLIACSGIKAEYFDEKIAFAENKHLPLCMNTSTMRFKSLDENTLNLRYLKYYFQTQSFKKQVFQVMTGSAQFNFGPTHLKYFKIPIPCLDEQIKIYQMFESIDIKILNIYREIMKVKEFKKGLLQQMFV